MARPRSAVAAALLTIMVMGGDVCRADRLYGNINLLFEQSRQEGATSFYDYRTQQTGNLGYEDALFYKNNLRLTANIQRRELTNSAYAEYRPTFGLELTGYQYSFDVRYSPYSRRAAPLSGVEEYDVNYRDWRARSGVTIEKLPSLGLLYSYSSARDELDGSRANGYTREIALSSDYAFKEFAFRVNLTNRRQRSYVLLGRDFRTTTYSGTIDYGRTLASRGYVSSTYNLYRTGQEASNNFEQSALTHSVAALASYNPLPTVSLLANYSGRFTGTKTQADIEESSRSQSLAGQVGYTPFDGLALTLNKRYQVSTADDIDDVLDYHSIGVTAGRSIRAGVDSRLAFNRTIFVESQRTRAVFDGDGNVVGTVNDGDYILDSYSASLNFWLYNYVRALMDLTVSHNNDPATVDSRYAMTRSVELRMDITRSLQGRLSYDNILQDDRLRWRGGFSETVNAGLTYLPASNLSLSAAYIFQDNSSGTRRSTDNYSVYVTYSFRRAYSLSFSINENRLTSSRLVAPETTVETIQRPRTVTAQLTAHLTRKLTLTMSLNRSRTENLLLGKTINRSIQSILILQL